MESTYDYSVTSTADSGAMAAVLGMLAGLWVVVMIVVVFMLICMWRIFTKAGKPGWAALIPIYNTIVLLEIIGRPVWWVIFLFAGIIPFVGWIISLAFGIIIALDLAKAFGKSTGFAILLMLLPVVGYPMLAFGNAEYTGAKPTELPAKAAEPPAAA